MSTQEMMGLRRLSTKLGLKEKDLKRLLIKSNILIDKQGLNPIAIEMGIAMQRRVSVNGVYRNQAVYNPNTINQIVNFDFEPLRVIEEQPLF